jgi:glycine/D-amino acid oxidase-like deaminating enzyme
MDAGWMALLPPPPPARRLSGEERAGSVVVGAGLTGLAIARRLAELAPGERVVLVEAQRAGFGASGRNAGIVVDLTDFAARMAPDDCRRYVRVARFGLRCLAGLVREHAIDCGWDDRGYLRAAAGEEGLRLLAQWPAWLDAAGIAHERLDAAAVAAVTGSRFYRAALRLPGTVTVQPAALVRGLAAALPREVELFEASPVWRIDRIGRIGRSDRIGRSGRATGGPPADAGPGRRLGGGFGGLRGFRGFRGFRIMAGDGTIHCDRLFLAANGYTPGLGFLRHRASPRWSFGSLTRVLTAAEQAALGGEERWAVLPCDPSGSTVRRLAGQRILIRNTFHYGAMPGVPEPVRAAAAARHRAAFDARFPLLRDVSFDHTWSGLYGTSANGQTSFGELEPGLYSAAVYNFAGLAMGTAAGRLLADLALGAGSPVLDDLRCLPRPTWLPPEPLRGLAGRWRVARQNSQAGAHL